MDGLGEDQARFALVHAFGGRGPVTVEQALERLNEKMKTMVVDYEITEILKTNILEIFPYDYQLSEAPKGTVSLGISNESVVLEL